ncbi:hypothetical protein [Paenibacillus sp.]|nr:hypothetical protein [Paenibacillus sp.]HZG55315.1 hypothetical protein [Paenibacillus sp.]
MWTRRGGGCSGDVAAAIQQRRLEHQRWDAGWLAGEKQKFREAK